MNGLRCATWLVVATLACSEPSGTTGDGFDEFETENFLFYHTDSDSRTIAALASEFDAHRTRIMADLGVDSVPQLLVYVYPNRRAFLTAHADIFERQAQGCLWFTIGCYHFDFLNKTFLLEDLGDGHL